jgi:hypothetical protein
MGEAAEDNFEISRLCPLFEETGNCMFQLYCPFLHTKDVDELKN